MKSYSKPTDIWAHQMVTEFIRLGTADQSIQIGFTDQKITGRAGLLIFAGFLEWHRFGDLLASTIPSFKKRKRGFEPFEFASGPLTSGPRPAGPSPLLRCVPGKPN